MSSTICERSRASSCMITSVSRYSPGSRSCDSATSASPRMIARGVRSSCEASAVTCRMPPNELSIRASKSLKTRAILPNSSPLFFYLQALVQILGADSLSLRGHRRDRSEALARQQIARQSGHQLHHGKAEQKDLP